MNYFLITGAARSGTTVLQQILNTNSAIACFHEYGLRELAKRVDALFDIERARNNLYSLLETPPVFYSSADSVSQRPADGGDSTAGEAEGHDPLPIPIRERHFSKIINSVFAVTSGKSNLQAVGDKLPNVIDGAYIDDLLPLFPELRLILIVRHPANVIKSSLARAAATREKLDLWHVSTFDEALNEWIKNWEFAARINESIGQRALFLKYENLKNNFDAEIQRVADFLCVPCRFANLMDPIEGNGDKYFLSADQEARVAERAGSLINDWAKYDARDLLNSYRTLPHLVNSGELIAMSGANALPHVLRDGFYGVEDWGVWTNGTHARIAFRIRGARKVEKIWIDICFLSFVGKMRDIVFGITVNDGDVEMVKLDAENAPVADSNAGLLCSVADGLVDIKFSIPRPKITGDEPVDDTRCIGLGLKSIRATIL